jgi:hypothetical protein
MTIQFQSCGSPWVCGFVGHQFSRGWPLRRRGRVEPLRTACRHPADLATTATRPASLSTPPLSFLIEPAFSLFPVRLVAAYEVQSKLQLHAQVRLHTEAVRGREASTGLRTLPSHVMTC